MPEVNLQHIDKIYDGGVQAVYDFNLDVADGELIVLVGPRSEERRVGKECL